MPIWEQLGMQAAGAAIGGTMGLINQGMNDRRQLRQQEKLQALQIRGNKELTDYNTQKQMEMWENTNYPAQMGMLKKAGLNPALLYGQGGGGGATANISAGNTTGAEAPKGGGEIGMGIQMGLQAQMMQAQIALTKAETAKTQAETGNVPLQGENIKASTASITQGILNQKAAAELTELQAEMQGTQNTIAKQTMGMSIATIKYQMEKINEEAQILKNEHKISDQTINTKVDLLKMELANATLEGFKKKAETANITQSTMESINRIQMAIQANMRDWDKLSQENRRIGLEKDQIDYSDFPKELTDIMEMIGLGAILKGGTTHNPIRGFHNR